MLFWFKVRPTINNIRYRKEGSHVEFGSSWKVHFFGFNLTFLRVDKFSKVFGYIFTINAVAAFVYAFHLKDDTQHMAALFYIGSSLGVVFADDVVPLCFFWEIMAVASAFLIFVRKTEKSPGSRHAVSPGAYLWRALSSGWDHHIYNPDRISCLQSHDRSELGNLSDLARHFGQRRGSSCICMTSRRLSGIDRDRWRNS